ncbi:nucleoside deaminase [Pontibacter sp. MBLB2868]|uniref:nucleoside deaminase n=1 Tax=Pontibacter sp. MBLB2868 TaxID=3451555 RepID=UPI003F7547A5
MEKTDFFMLEAIRLSLTKMKEGYGGPFGAVIVYQGEIIARGFNRVLETNDPTTHAEVDAIRKASEAMGCSELTECELYTSCEPCPMCLGAIYWAKLKKVYYGNTHQDAAAIGFDDAFIYKEIERPLSQRHIPMLQLLPEEAKVAFEEWQKQENKTNC